MAASFSRRSWLSMMAAALPAGRCLLDAEPAEVHGEPMPGNEVTDAFPSHPPELTREMVTLAHFDLARVKELVEARPSLARAAWDWGFGDWEDALGAASHMGNRAMAEYLISKGARPSIFSAAMLGQLGIVKGFLAAHPGAQTIRGPHSISLLAHARVGGAAAGAVFELLQSLPDSDTEAPVALPEAETTVLVGTYVFGVGVNQQVVIDGDMKMYARSMMYTHAPQLNWTRKGTMSRPLFHLGDHTFYPAGARAVRIRFTQESAGVLMTVSDGDSVIKARRQANLD